MASRFLDRQERFYLFNTLAVLIKTIEGERTTVDLRNEASIYGVVEQADGYMNILMKDCIFIDPRGHSFKYEIFFVQARNIRYVHIPPNKRIIPSIKDQIDKMSVEKVAPTEKKNKKLTLKQKKAKKLHAEGIQNVNKILEVKKEKESEQDSLQ